MYDRREIEAILPTALKGRSPQQYLQDSAAKLKDWLTSPQGGNLWMSFGPWWPVVQRVILASDAECLPVRQWNGGDPAPEYLAGYDFGDDISGNTLNIVAALTYLNRHGDYMEHPRQPHEVTLSDGDRRLYRPGIGLLDRDQ
ncbi:MAG: hypothetical protein O2890_02875 [Cyanobacteria bacterium]|nr:hypothetical protein [Cyanobacteriota bacterium]MDA0865359.1 hypothetical protein [Cyanobacteriota bacterium]